MEGDENQNEGGCYVGNLPCDITQEQLMEIEAFDNVTIRSLHKKGMKTFCFVECGSTKNAVDFSRAMNGFELMGRKLAVRVQDGRQIKSRNIRDDEHPQFSNHQTSQKYGHEDYSQMSHTYSSNKKENCVSLPNCLPSDVPRQEEEKESMPPLLRPCAMDDGPPPLKPITSPTTPLNLTTSRKDALHDQGILNGCPSNRSDKSCEQEGMCPSNSSLSCGNQHASIAPCSPKGNCTHVRPNCDSSVAWCGYSQQPHAIENNTHIHKPPQGNYQQGRNQECSNYHHYALPSNQHESQQRAMNRPTDVPGHHPSNRHESQQRAMNRPTNVSGHHPSNWHESQQRAMGRSTNVSDPPSNWHAPQQRAIGRPADVSDHHPPNWHEPQQRAMGRPSDVSDYQSNSHHVSYLPRNGAPSHQRFPHHQRGTFRSPGGRFSSQPQRGRGSFHHGPQTHLPRHSNSYYAPPQQPTHGDYVLPESTQGVILSIANFPWGTTEEMLYELFEDFEPIAIKMICNSQYLNMATEAFVIVSDEEQAFNAIMEFDGTNFGHRTLSVEIYLAE